MSADSPSRTVIDPYGDPLTIDTLPPTNTVRWVPRRKAQVVCAIREGLISRLDACDRYGISDAELLSWESLLESHGPRALRITSRQRSQKEMTSMSEDPQGTVTVRRS